MKRSKKALEPKKQTNEEESFAKKSVRRFKEAEKEVRDFMNDPDVIDILRYFHRLIETRNERLGEAVRAVKAELARSEQEKLFIDGIGAQKRTSVYYDLDHLRAYLPEEQLRLVITERIVYDLHEEDLVRLVRQGEIDEEIVKQAYKETPGGVASLPGTPKPWELPPLPSEEDLG